ncbi:MAG: hypothetical protein OEV14_03550 [Gammaproteobacteria bacterium]|nr:hypothetical protein [Gammaproteobacteria bacterium]
MRTTRGRDGNADWLARGTLPGCLLIGCMAAVAGPPLSIDDPGILDPGKLELILATSVETRPSGDTYLLPILDVSLGVSENVQVSAVATRAVWDPDGGSSKSDFGPGAIGAKWRFVNQGALQLSVAPYYEAPLRDGAEDRGVLEFENSWVLPAEFQYDFEHWTVNAEAGYAFSREEWGYGVAATVPLNDSIAVLGEVHGGSDRYFNDDGTLYRVGIDLAFTEAWHLLASVGSSISEPGNDDLDLQGYLGLQWFP